MKYSFAKLNRQQTAFGLPMAFALLLSASIAAAAQFPNPASSRSYHPYPPIELTNVIFDNPRPIRAWVVTIDLASPDIEFAVTPPSSTHERFDTEGETTLEFAERNNVQLAINATPFSPYRMKSGEGMELLGLAICNGERYSAPHTRYGSLLIAGNNQVDILPPPISDTRLADVENALGGMHILVLHGKNRAAVVEPTLPSDFTAPDSRTAIGLSRDRKTMWFIVVDGRDSKRTEGMTLAELANFSITLGCDKLLNMDGGGSTTLVLQDPAHKRFREVNQPVGKKILGTMRPVGANLGVRVRTARPEK